MFKDKTLAENVSALLIIYIVILGLSYCLYFALVKVGMPTDDFVDISVCASTLLGPIILLFTLTAWKEQHNKSVLKDISFEGIKDLLTIKNSLDLIRLAKDRIFITHGIEGIFHQDIELIYQNHIKAQSASLDFQSKIEIFKIYNIFDKDIKDFDLLINECLMEIEVLIMDINALNATYAEKKAMIHKYESRYNLLTTRELTYLDVLKEDIQNYEGTDIDDQIENYRNNKFEDGLSELKDVIDGYIQLISKVTVA
ncbi:hypothetical protein [Alkanindiges illinoisensis]|uniref:hypothetical protein n=1 Tax=Alkanindiges illinoisensis TaxID=197183 RepID=UPI00047E4BBF|nr:hypothetical protein [Alkanindiges illinoisensis]